jgi:hemolysin III
MMYKNTIFDEMTHHQTTSYPVTEERFNVVSHALGFVLSVLATGLMLAKADNRISILSSLVFGSSMMLLYAASTLYHNSTVPKIRNRLNILDHAAIYVLIAGTYTPFSLITLKGNTGIILLSAVWIFTLTGVILKLWFTGKYDRLSTLMYLFMCWMVLFAIKPLLINLAAHGLYWLLAGGVSYTVGALFYSIQTSIKYNHAIFHVLVLLGSLCHFISIYYWVL